MLSVDLAFCKSYTCYGKNSQKPEIVVYHFFLSCLDLQILPVKCWCRNKVCMLPVFHLFSFSLYQYKILVKTVIINNKSSLDSIIYRTFLASSCVKPSAELNFQLRVSREKPITLSYAKSLPINRNYSKHSEP